MTRRIIALIAIALCVMCITQMAWAGPWTQIWFKVCHIMKVNPAEFKEPKIYWVTPDDPRVRGCWAVYYPLWNEIYTFTYSADVIAHEFAHAIMCSPAFQEPIAYDMEKHFK